MLSFYADITLIQEKLAEAYPDGFAYRLSNTPKNITSETLEGFATQYNDNPQAQALLQAISEMLRDPRFTLKDAPVETKTLFKNPLMILLLMLAEKDHNQLLSDLADIAIQCFTYTQVPQNDISPEREAAINKGVYGVIGGMFAIVMGALMLALDTADVLSLSENTQSYFDTGAIFFAMVGIFVTLAAYSHYYREKEEAASESTLATECITVSDSALLLNYVAAGKAQEMQEKITAVRDAPSQRL